MSKYPFTHSHIANVTVVCVRLVLKSKYSFTDNLFIVNQVIVVVGFHVLPRNIIGCSLHCVFY
jgi:hypothetical protein